MYITMSLKYKCLLVLLVAMISPLLCFLISLFLALDLNRSKECSIVFWFSLVLFFALININQIWESDTLGYVLWMKNAISETLPSYLMQKNGQELVFFFTNYAFARITNGWGKLYLLTYNLLFYYFFIRTIYMIGDREKWSLSHINWGIFFILFYITYFTGSLQLMRQAIAGVMIVYIIVGRVMCGYSFKKIIALSFVAIGIHSSSAFPLLFLLIPGLDQRLSLKKCFYLIFIIGVLLVIYNSLPSLHFGLDNALPDIAKRSSTNYSEDAFKLSFMSFIPSILLVFSFLKYSTSSTNILPSNIRYLSIVGLFMLFIYFLPYNSFVQVRFLCYLQYFVPSVLLFALETKTTLNRFIKNVLLCLILVVFFIYIVLGKSKVQYPLTDTLFAFTWEIMKDPYINY